MAPLLAPGSFLLYLLQLLHETSEAQGSGPSVVKGTEEKVFYGPLVNLPTRLPLHVSLASRVVGSEFRFGYRAQGEGLNLGVCKN